MDAALIVVVVVAFSALVAVWYFIRLRKSKTLQDRFGPEYESAVKQYGDRSKAESDLARRVERVERFSIKPLSEPDRLHYAELWRENQSRFVDDPGGAIAQADHLVNDVMRARGYPLSDFDNRAADLSVDYPHVVRNYRSARALAERHSRGEASTEDLRRGLVYYRELFEELLQPQKTWQEMNK
jgi:hypothetical protein